MWLVLLLILTYQLLPLGTTVVKANASVINPLGRKIDLFTQKEPYSGKGINKSSDAFAPQSVVILYALVTYNEEPVEYMLVSFEVIPPNPIDGFPLHRSSFTNASGIASLNFTIPWPGEHPEEIVFGTWFAAATVEVIDEKVVDTLTFKVGWIVEIVSISTIDGNLNPKIRFPKATCVGTKLHIRNIAMLPKTATIVVTAFDALNASFDSVVFNDLVLEPGDTYILKYCFLNISEQAAVGNAVVKASAYTALPSMGGTSYCPEVSANFIITSRDIAVVKVTTSVVDSVIAGQIVNITVIVKNKGNDTETFFVSTYYGQSLIQRLSVTLLPPNQNRTVAFQWNTTNVPPGSYVISAVAEPLRGETERGDNTKIDDTVIVRVPIFMVPRELSIMALIVASALALFAIILLLTRKKKNNPQPAILNVDVLPNEE